MKINYYKELFLTLLLFAGSLFSVFSQALVNNNGALISIKDSALVIVKTNSVNNETGYISNAGRFIIEEDFINTDTATGGMAKGRYEVERHWENSGVFIADSSTVELYGANQLITGDSVTEFHHLQLTGTGIKTQTIDAKVNSLLELNDRELATDTSKMFVINPGVSAVSRTTGFVSSLADGRLSREMNRDTTYLFPVGSSIGTQRYRPITITPPVSNPKTFEVRMANVDATSEGFDRSETAPDICEINPEFYHLIDTTEGQGAVDLTFFYDAASDGDWSEVAHWEGVPQWESTRPNPGGVSGAFNTLAINGWDTYQYEAYALARPSPSLDYSNVNDVSCYGNNDGVIVVDAIIGTPDFTYEWNAPGLSGDSISGLSPGEYSLTITDANNCQATDTLVIYEPDSLELEASADVTISYGTSTDLEVIYTAGGAPFYEYLWEPDAGLNNTTGEYVTASPDSTTSYIVTVIDENGCRKTDTVVVNVDHTLYVFPEGFTPNGDGHNDNYEIIKSEGVEVLEFKIYNRWGELIY
ncbi:MAG: gliding motility-associated C-terminal domain-containing protein, partial [Balneolales bacterium]